MNQSEYQVSTEHRTILRELAAQVAELAASPRQQELRQLWERHNRLESQQPLIVANIGDSWPAVFEVKIPRAHFLHGYEWQLRHAICLSQMGYDNLVAGTLVTPYLFQNVDFGIPVPMTQGTATAAGKGSYIWDPPIKEEADLNRLRSETRVDLAASRERYEFLHAIFGDILPVNLEGGYGFCIDERIAKLRGMEQMMADMYDNPAFLHRLMAFIRDVLISGYQYAEREKLLGFTDDGRPRRLRDCSIGQSSQTFTGTSPQMFAEFLFAYQKPVFELFGTSGYGCCEPLHDRLDIVMQLRNLRWITVSPWSRADICAATIKDRYAYAWRPHPAHVFADDFQPAEIRRGLQKVRDVTLANKCIVDITLQDVSTTNGRPERFREWLAIAREIFH